MSSALFAASTIYITLFIITLLCYGAIYLMAGRDFGRRSDHFRTVVTSLKNYLQILGAFAVLTTMAITFGWLKADWITYCCIPLFPMIMVAWSTYFRVKKHYKTYGVGIVQEK